MAIETEASVAARASWQGRVIVRTRGQQTMLGAVFLAALGKRVGEPRSFGHAAAIVDGPDGGWVLSRFIDRTGSDKGAIRVCSVDDLVGSFSRLADDLKLNDADRIALFKTVRDWIATDERAIKDSLHFTASQRGN